MAEDGRLRPDDPFWTLGTLVVPKITAQQTGGRFALWENVFGRGASPPVHTHPQGESFYVLDGELALWLDGERSKARPGSTLHAPAGTPHSFRVESGTARVIVLSTPAGIEELLRELGSPADSLTLPPAEAPRPSSEQRSAIERAHGMEVLGPPPGD